MLATYARTEHALIHVTPFEDDVDHDLRGFRRVCGPRVKYVEDGWVVQHKALRRSE